jgi:hypothetical protein
MNHLYPSANHYPRRTVWHAGFLEEQEAKEISMMIRRRLLKEELRQWHPGLAIPDCQEQRQESSEALRQRYQALTGEAWNMDIYADDEIPELEMIQVKLQLWQEHLHHITTSTTQDATGKQRLVESAAATIKAIEEEYETIKGLIDQNKDLN